MMPMLMQIFGAVINIILDPILIFGYFGLPALGVSGAAIATVIGQFSAAILAFILFKRYNTHLHISFKGLKIDFHVMSQLYSVAVPSTVMMCLPSGCWRQFLKVLLLSLVFIINYKLLFICQLQVSFKV